MFGLDTSLLVLLVVCLIFACAFEFVNGFHDTANAVATVIYTNSLKPVIAVIWSGLCNFTGVFAGGIAVAMGIVNLLPMEALIDQNIYHSIAMVLALIISAITWNLATWYVGLPASSSHTLIGSIFGVGLAFSFMPENTAGVSLNWSKASEIGMSLLISPLFGFSVTLLFMTILTRTIKNKIVFDEPRKDAPPPLLMRALLIATCTLVSFFHGSNDGQKGVGLVMLILIGIVPAYFALDNTIDTTKTLNSITKIESVLSKVDTNAIKDSKDKASFLKSVKNFSQAKEKIAGASSSNEIAEKDRFLLRKNVLVATKGIEKLIEKGKISLSKEDTTELKKEIKSTKKITDYAPFWVILMISLSLGLGTMIGWKRIVRTIGEKIGKTHMSYAQGFSAELVAASTIGLSTSLGLPVSTTHVLSSGIAGSMVSGKGLKNLQPKTVRNIVIAWVLTLPVCIILSGGLFILFRFIL